MGTCTGCILMADNEAPVASTDMLKHYLEQLGDPKWKDANVANRKLVLYQFICKAVGYIMQRGYNRNAEEDMDDLTCLNLLHAIDDAARMLQQM